jgi:sugar phosphate isomerase/epimerase
MGLMDTAVELDLAGVEFGVPAKDHSLEALKDALESRGLKIVADAPPLLNVEAEVFRDSLKAAAFVGSKGVRATLSGILCGKRYELPEGWRARMDALAQRLKEVLPFAEDLGLYVALENHQDATTDDLLELAERANFSPSFGVTLDAGNPLAVGEEPVQAAQRLGPILRHLHMKDYTIHFAPEGYRLVRCAAGDGVVDFPAILDIVKRNGHDVLPGIEIGAQATRTIPWLQDEWWTTFPPHHAAHLPAALRVLWAKGRPMDEPYSSAWERGEDSEAVSAEEWTVLRRSVDYFRSVVGVGY